MKIFTEGYFMASERSRWDAMTIALRFEVWGGQHLSHASGDAGGFLSCFTLVAQHCLGCRLGALPAHLTWMPSWCGTKSGKNKVLCYVMLLFRVPETFLVHLNGGLPPQGQQSSVGCAGWNLSPAPALYPKQVPMTNGINCPFWSPGI